MFGNFLYFVIALLIYTTYPPPAQPQMPLLQALGFFAAISLLFAALTRILFKKLEDRIVQGGNGDVHQSFESLIVRQCIIAIGLFAVNIYALELSGYLQQITVVQHMPTLGAILFLGVFLGYLCIVWASAHKAHEKLYHTGITRRRYVVSHITFSIPVLLPWFFLSLAADLIYVLPFDAPRAFLNSTTGQILYFLFFLFVIAVFGPALIQYFWGCRPLAAGDARTRIEDLCRRAGVSYREIMQWPLFGGGMITAGVMGLVSRFRYILVTPGLLRYLAPEEIEAVVAHEIGHVKHRHLYFYLIFLAGYMVISFAALDFIVYAAVYLQTVFGAVRAGGETFVSVVFSLAMIGTFFVYFRFGFGYFMRNFERQADISVYRLMDSALPLITTFHKIAASSGQSPDRPNWHHFSISDRIDYLRKCEANPGWIRRHHRKVRLSMAVYLAIILGLASVGYSLHFGTAGEKLSGKMAEQILTRQIGQQPKDPELHVMLGDLYYSRNNLSAATEAYQQALDLDAGNVAALNNLAWIYATSEPETGMFKPQQALELAQKAADRSLAPHVTDTLAEALFVNRQYEKAVEAAEKALSAATDRRDYYRSQLRRFEQALEDNRRAR
ncbi:MAG: M48 family metalloprotease [Desulfosalsimonas sp.]